MTLASRTTIQSGRGFVVCAETEYDARRAHPDGVTICEEGHWSRRLFENEGWVAPETIGELRIERLGVANSSLAKGVVLTDFRHG